MFYEPLSGSNFERINNDVNGNPRYVFHYLDIESESYADSLAIARKLLGTVRKYNTKNYCGGVCLSTYNLDRIINTINLHNLKCYLDARLKNNAIKNHFMIDEKLYGATFYFEFNTNVKLAIKSDATRKEVDSIIGALNQ